MCVGRFVQPTIQHWGGVVLPLPLSPRGAWLQVSRTKRWKLQQGIYPRILAAQVMVTSHTFIIITITLELQNWKEPQRSSGPAPASSTQENIPPAARDHPALVGRF